MRKFEIRLGLYFIWYGLGRSYFESVRIDPSLVFLGLRTNVWAAIAAIVIGIMIFVVQTRRHPGLEPSVYVPGREWTPAAAVDSTDIYSDTDETSDGAALPGTTVAEETKATTPATSGAGTK